MSNIGDYIKELRELKGYSQRRLGNVSNVSNVTISRTESGSIIPSPATLKNLASALEVNYEELMEIAGYIYRNKFIPSSVKLVREKSKLTFCQFSDELKKVTGEDIAPTILEFLEKGKNEYPLPSHIDAIAKYIGISTDFFFRENTLADLENAIISEPYKGFEIKDPSGLSHIKDAKLKKWLGSPACVDYLELARKISDLGMDANFVYNEFVVKISRKLKRKKAT